MSTHNVPYCVPFVNNRLSLSVVCSESTGTILVPQNTLSVVIDNPAAVDTIVSVHVHRRLGVNYRWVFMFLSDLFAFSGNILEY